MTKSLLLLILTACPIAIAIGQQKGATPLAPGPGAASAKSTYALVVGISDYQDPAIPDLLFADKDAEAFANYLRSEAGGRLDADHLKVLTNEQATGGKVAAALYWLVDESRENDQVIIYFSGHGDVERKFVGQPGFLLCWDSPPNVYMGGGSVELGMLQSVISTLSIENKSKVLFIADACHSGKLAGSSIKGSQLTHANLSRQFANEVKILSCQANEYSLEGSQWGGGRGAFSYHLVNGLYGLANQDGDDQVSLKELGRYLEDRVSIETAPEKQNPVVLGDREVHISRVDPQLLTELRKGTNGQMPKFSAFENRGLEEEVLSALDTGIQRLYRLFQEKLESRAFFEPAKDCAEFYYNRLAAEPGLSRLHNTMRRNYAAALQDDAQQVMSNFLKSDMNELYRSVKAKYKSYPLNLERASQLLGPRHYMYPSLLARKEFFEGYNLFYTSTKKTLGRLEEVLGHFRRALQWQSDFPLAYLLIADVYRYRKFNSDSVVYYYQRAIEINPSWLLAYVSLVQSLINEHNNLDLAKLYLDHTNQIDSNSALTALQWGLYYSKKDDSVATEHFFKKAIQLDPTFISPRQLLLMTYIYSNRISDAKKEIQQISLLDSTAHFINYPLAIIAKAENRHSDAERYYLMAIQLDSINAYAYRFHLGRLYLELRRYSEAEIQFQEYVQNDSINSGPYFSVGKAYHEAGRYSEAEYYYKRAIQLGNKNTLRYLGDVYLVLNRTEEARKSYVELLESLDTSKKAPNTLFGLAVVYARSNDIPKAFEYLEKSLEAGFADRSKLDTNADLTMLRNQPEWTLLMNKYFPDQKKGE